MRVKTFRGSCASAVMARIKAELGPDAAILSTRSVKEDGRTICEIMAAVEPAEPASTVVSMPHVGRAAQLIHAAQAAQAAQNAESAKAARPRAGAETSGRGAPVQSKSQPTQPEQSSRPARQAQATQAAPPGALPGEDWAHIRDLLMEVAGKRMDLSALPGRARQAMRYLEREEVGEGARLKLYLKLRNDPRATVLGALSELCPVRPLGMAAWPQRVQLVCGPAGAGKTATVLRMALAARRNRPGSRICLAVAGDERGASRLELKHYAQLLGMHFREVADGAQGAKLVHASGDFDLVLVEIAPVPRGESLASHLDRFGLGESGTLRRAPAHLVLSPTMAPGQLKAYLDVYAPRAERAQSSQSAVDPRQPAGNGPVRALVWTKLDEACRFGSMIDVGNACGLPVSAFSCGCGLKDSLFPATDKLVWQLLFRHQLPGGEIEAGAASQPAPAAAPAPTAAKAGRKTRGAAHAA